MRDRIDDIRARGAELVIVGNGSPHFAATFRDDYALDCPLLVDPELRAYRVAGLRRGRVEMLSPRLPGHAIRAFRGGARQGAVQGDPWQLGGTFVIRPGFSGKVEEFGMLVPFPSPPALRKVPEDVFAQVAAAVDPPEVVVYTQQFFGGGYQLVELDNEQQFDLDGLKGRLRSSSYVPAPGEARFEPMMNALREIFEAHHSGGTVTMTYRTQLYVAMLR